MDLSGTPTSVSPEPSVAPPPLPTAESGVTVSALTEPSSESQSITVEPTAEMAVSAADTVETPPVQEIAGEHGGEQASPAVEIPPLERTIQAPQEVAALSATETLTPVVPTTAPAIENVATQPSGPELKPVRKSRVTLETLEKTKPDAAAALVESLFPEGL